MLLSLFCGEQLRRRELKYCREETRHPGEGEEKESIARITATLKHWPSVSQNQQEMEERTTYVCSCFHPSK